MWRKREQLMLWGTAYLPLILIMTYSFIDGNNWFKNTFVADFLKKYISKTLFDVVVIILIIIVSIVLYKLIVRYLFKDYENQLHSSNFGNKFVIRKYEKLSVNDYSFFLVTLLLPLVSLDYSSAANYTVSLFIIFFIVLIYVKTDSVSVCPVFFLSKWYVYRAIMSNNTRQEEQENPFLRKEVYIITLTKTLDLDRAFKAKHLVKNVYYVSQIDRDY
ncbi:hypothetical protein [Sediminibacillus halophilus]|uniref:Uncharacterized protein n=1 Tax=Sediminibacillus halophilus TaxID=482461 RepID=A0A1G9QVG4_9BACI|nr:hypothetical protein [Sediminibacillus halophilus]SDM15012.1 hypothetical protein SAMN05216244_1687 [Sediminibacillus halophilus]